MNPDTNTNIFSDKSFGKIFHKPENTQTFSSEQELVLQKGNWLSQICNEKDLNGTIFACSCSSSSLTKPATFLNNLYGNYFMFTSYSDNTFIRSSNLKQAEEELREILLIASKEMDQENHESLSFVGKIQQWMEKYSSDSIGVFLSFYKSGRIEQDILSKILEVMGKINDANSYGERVLILEYFIQDESPIVRYGAITGISNLESVELITAIKKALNIEKSPLLIGIAKSVKEQLEELT